MNLKIKYKQMLLDIFSAHLPNAEVWAYGSRVTGDAHDGSDLDLVIVPEIGKKLPLEVLSELKIKIRDSNVPILVDLFDWTRLPESFQRNIEACHEVFYRASTNLVNEAEADYQTKPSDN
jgi:predicted nucleotidyltransferase